MALSLHARVVSSVRRRHSARGCLGGLGLWALQCGVVAMSGMMHAITARHVEACTPRFYLVPAGAAAAVGSTLASDSSSPYRRNQVVGASRVKECTRFYTHDQPWDASLCFGKAPVRPIFSASCMVLARCQHDVWALWWLPSNCIHCSDAMIDKGHVGCSVHRHSAFHSW
jgi:hypothetical protein